MIAVAVRGAVETFTYEVEDAGLVMDIVFEFEATEVVSVHYDEPLSTTVVLGHDVVAFAGLTVGLIGHLDSLSKSEAGFEFSKDIHNYN